MEKRIAALVSELELNEGATPGLIEEVEAQLSVTLPTDYREFMAESNGVEGGVGAHSYLVLWQLEEIIPLNEAYAVREFAPGLILFGSDGGGEAYAFDARKASPTIVAVPFIGMSVEEARPLGASLLELLWYLHEQ
jgi:cell wall assembly regulator SMI1